MVTGEWLACWTGVNFFCVFSVERRQGQRERGVRDRRDGNAQKFFPASFPAVRVSCSMLSCFVRPKGEQIAPVLHASEWSSFLTYSEESLCIKVDPVCGVVNVDKKAGSFTFHYFRWKRFRRETTIGNTSAHAQCEFVENGEKCQLKNTRILVDEAWHQYPN